MPIDLPPLPLTCEQFPSEPSESYAIGFVQNGVLQPINTFNDPYTQKKNCTLRILDPPMEGFESA